ncbi:SDR family NAD(P)-dependent oxidoreductase [Maribacter antarcticus]|uniref:SDR family NAD(P)-dependent oxidoreductase n=1 Tax=Maribacter antarcticus TaxID=505250 RepID=UPI000479AC5F|nr:SDR family NAD(P)-dependent oxidoreductase [Maribacter antarcticus]
MNSKLNTEQVIVITGSSTGLGASLIKHYAKQGFKVVINYINEEHAFKLYDEIAKQFGKDKVLKFKANVSKRSEVKAMFDGVINEFGSVDILINCAGINRDSLFIDMTDDLWDEVVNTHLKGHFISSQEFVFHSLDNKEGLIINLGAAAGQIGRKNGANFCAAKGGVFALTKAMALELAPRIRVNCLVPNAIKTKEVIERYDLSNKVGLAKELSTMPMARLGEYEDVHQMMDSIIGAKFTTGSTFYVNGGQYMH